MHLNISIEHKEVLEYDTPDGWYSISCGELVASASLCLDGVLRPPTEGQKLKKIERDTEFYLSNKLKILSWASFDLFHLLDRLLSFYGVKTVKQFLSN